MTVTECSAVKKLVIHGVPNRDVIAVYLEDQGEGKGKITITCFNDSWSYYWCNMGPFKLVPFLLQCYEDYLVHKLDPSLPAKVNNWSKLYEAAQNEVIRRRWEGTLDKDNARYLYDRCFWLQEVDSFEAMDDNVKELLWKIFGDEWWSDIPKMPNPRFEDLRRLVCTVKEGLKLYQQQGTE